MLSLSAESILMILSVFWLPAKECKEFSSARENPQLLGHFLQI